MDFFDITKKYKLDGNKISFKLNGDFTGEIRGDHVIYGLEDIWVDRGGEIENIGIVTNYRISADSNLINTYKEVLSFNPLTILPKGYEGEIEGPFPNEITIENTFDFYVAVAIQKENYSSYFLINPNGGINFRYLLNGSYKIYYVYYNDKGSLYQGDDINVLNQKVQVTLKRVGGGNYNIKKIR